MKLSNCPDCGGTCIPENAVILNELRIVEYVDPDDQEIYKVDLSCGADGDDLLMSKQLELAEWARLMATAPLLADMVESWRAR